MVHRKIEDVISRYLDSNEDKIWCKMGLDKLAILPIEVKSGSDKSNFRALLKIVKDSNYRIEYSYVLSNKREVKTDDKIIYLQIYFVMFI